jgi:hypothetical protein
VFLLASEVLADEAQAIATNRLTFRMGSIFQLHNKQISHRERLRENLPKEQHNTV